MENLNLIKKACFSGYRPEKFDFKLNNRDASYKRLISRLNETVSSLIEGGCTVFYCGMAQGFDIIAAECVLSFKKKHKDVRLVCAVPFQSHANSIGGEWRKRYDKIVSKCDELVYVCNEYHVSCFQIRNRYMVDNSDCVVCWYDGKTGGTRNTIKYAQNVGRYIINLNTEYERELNDFREKLPLI